MQFSELLQQEYFRSLAVIIVAFAFAKIFHPLLTKYLKKLSAGTKTDLDDKMIQVLTRPVYNLILLFGLFIASKNLTLLENHTLFIDRTFFALTVLLVSFVLSKIISVLIARWLQVQKKYQKTPQLITKVVTVVIYIIASLMILNHFSIEISPLIATLGIGGLAAGLALQSTLANFFSGLYIISDRPVNVGDFIEIDAALSGFVEDIGWRSTKIRTWHDTTVIIPNSKLAESTIINNSLSDRSTNTRLVCGVDYHSDLEKVEKITLDVARNVQNTLEYGVKDWEPVMRFNKFAESNIEFFIFLKAKDILHKSMLKHEFIKALKKRYAKEKIEISWPIRKIYNKK